jgi:oxygen-dependent protoporphyrinogen oxidase
VIGGGPSGLSCCYQLKKKAHELGIEKITLFEKSERLGGWINSYRLKSSPLVPAPISSSASSSTVLHMPSPSSEYLFDSGPRSLRGTTSSAIHTIRLIEELGLQEKLIPGSPASANRLLFLDGRLQEISLKSQIGLFVLIPAAIREIFEPR